MRTSWFSKINVPDNCSEFLLAEQLKLVLNSPENVKVKTQFIIDDYNMRSKIEGNTATI